MDAEGYGRQVDELRRALLGLVELQRELALRGAQPASSASIDGIVDQLDALRQQLKDNAEEAGPPHDTVAVQHLGEIDVERINIVEPDGTRRLVISNKSRAPDPVIDGITFQREHPNPSGMIFYNEEGDECGGLVYTAMCEDGKTFANAGIMFDQFKQDQTLGLIYTDTEGQRSAGLHVWDRPDTPLAEVLSRSAAIERMPDGPEKTRALEESRVQGAWGAQRVFVGKTPAREAVVNLRDGRNRPRLRLVVSTEGDARVEFLGADGEVVYQLPPGDGA